MREPLIRHPIVQYAYVVDDLGCFVELYGRTERSAGFFAGLRDLHRGWDGVTDPVRER